MRRKFANTIFSRGNFDEAVGGNPSAPVDVINAAAHVFERKWAKRLKSLLSDVFMLTSVV